MHRLPPAPPSGVVLCPRTACLAISALSGFVCCMCVYVQLLGPSPGLAGELQQLPADELTCRRRLRELVM